MNRPHWGFLILSIVLVTAASVILTLEGFEFVLRWVVIVLASAGGILLWEARPYR